MRVPKFLDPVELMVQKLGKHIYSNMIYSNMISNLDKREIISIDKIYHRAKFCQKNFFQNHLLKNGSSRISHFQPLTHENLMQMERSYANESC